MGLAEKLMEHSIPEPNSGCWLWLSATNGKGYGQLTFQQKHLSAHRASYETFVGPIPAGMLVCHKCDTPACINPKHLYTGTHADNHADALNRGRWSHPYAANTACRQGHTYTPTSYRIARDGSRVCRTCMRDHKRRYREKIK